MRPTPFLFGKVPDRGDFVRAGPLSPLLDELDAWLQRGLLVHRRPIAEAPSIGFVLGRAGGVLLGAFSPSRDRAGRAFPMVAGATVAAPVNGALIARWAPLLRAAVSGASEVAAGAATLDDALVRLDATEPALPGAILEQAASALFGPRPVEAVATRLADLLGPVHDGGPALRYGVGLPLPDDPDARPAAVAFWLDAATRAAGPVPSPSLLWTAEGARARLALFLGPPTSDALAYLLAGTPADGVYDLDYDLPDAAPEDEAPTLRALLDRL